MSQIPSAYAPDAAAIDLADARAARGDRDGALAAQRECELPAFPWSGYAVVIFHEWLSERALSPPASDVAPALQALFEPLICIRASEAGALMTRLRAASVGDAELAEYWAQWTGDESPAAMEFMASSHDWVISAATAGATASALIVLVH